MSAKRKLTANESDGPVSVAALCRAVVRCLGVDGVSVTGTNGLAAHEPLCASDDLSAQLEELQCTTGEGPGAEDLAFAASRRRGRQRHQRRARPRPWRAALHGLPHPARRRPTSSDCEGAAVPSSTGHEPLLSCEEHQWT